MIEMVSKSEINEERGQHIHWLIEVVSKCKMSEGGREPVNRLIESNR